MDIIASSSADFLDPLSQLGCAKPAPTLLSRRRNSRKPTTGGGPANGKYPSLTPTPEDGPQKIAVCGFLPLPSITASPICTPTSTENAYGHGLLEEEHTLMSKGSEEYVTAPNTPSGIPLGLTATPTWISTPPTPPPRMVRRSVTWFTRSPSPLPPSASFPATTPPRVKGEGIRLMARRASTPSMSLRQRASSDTFVRLGGSDVPKNARTFTIAGSSQTACDVLPDSIALSTTRPKAKFHIPYETCTDTDDINLHILDSPVRTHEEISAEGSWSTSENDSDDTWQLEKAKDDIRKYHALRELLATEIGYLLDLRALVTVYLRIIPTLVSRSPPSLSTFGRASSSFTSSPWVNSYSHLHAATLSSSATLSDTPATLASTQNAKDQTKMHRYLFTDHEVELLTRNAEEILQLHEQFVRELRDEMIPLGFPIDLVDRVEDWEKHQKECGHNLDAAIRAVSTKFATEASRFDSYQSFCTGHPGALDIIRKVHSQHPVEWDAFEQRCSSLVFELELSTPTGPDTPDSRQPLDDLDVVPTSAVKDRTRTSSLSSIDGAVRTLRTRASGLSPKERPVIFPSETRKEKSPPRLAFMDYLIKPVQRICKYPLVLDQLKPSKFLRAYEPARPRSDVDVVVESATQAMRHVASSVDEARHRQDSANQSALIISRVSLAGHPGSHVSARPPLQPLTLSFLSSLGTCLLAGSLDVMYYHAIKSSGTLNISAKYFGAFLYPGGYLVLVKVTKGNVYEPKHWFSLQDFDILDIEEDDAMLPCSFRLSSKEHRFELAASCQREKDVWLNFIRKSLIHPFTWANESPSSLRFDGKSELIPTILDDVPSEASNILPTIQSVPELAGGSECPDLTESYMSGSEVKQRRIFQHDVPISKQDIEPPSRRSSTASVKGIFSPLPSDSETIVIRRSSAPARSRVDQGLKDVISQPCLTARSYASSREELLFRVPRINRAGFTRSHSGLTMASMAKSRLTKHESVRVLRRKSFIDGSETLPAKKLMVTPVQSLSSRRHTKNLCITALSEGDITSFNRNSDNLSSPSPFSQSSSITCTTPGSASPSSSPTCRSIFLGTSSPSTAHIEAKPPLKTSRSLVDNMKGLFYPRSASPIASAVARADGLVDTPETEHQSNKTITPSVIKRWAKGSLHRRARSAPEAPENVLPLPSKEPQNGHNQRPPNLEVEAPLPMSRSNSIIDPRITHISSTNPTRRKSLLSSTFRHSPPIPEMDSTHRGATKSTLLQRLKT